MKNTLLIAAICFLSIGCNQAQVNVNVPTPPPESSQKVQVAILFDTSNSMDGLIDQAKSRIWSIVNEVSTLTYNGETPQIEIGLYHYGNDNLSMTKNYIEQVVPLTSDLDLISEKLFGLRTNGGSEYCGAVIGQSLDELNWSDDPTDLKMIYIAGNEAFDQGPVSFKEACKRASKQGIFINTIYCGNYETGVKEFWKEGATCSGGDYFNIDSDRAIVHYDTPYDDQINSYNDSLNSTYYGYGSIGKRKKTQQVMQDGNAEMESVAVKTERSIVKSKGKVYKNSTWDVVDATEEGNIDVKELSEEELPEEFKGKTDAEKDAMVLKAKKDRERYQKTIGELATKREAYIAEEKKKKANDEDVDDFGTSVNESIMKKAKINGFEKEATKK